MKVSRKNGRIYFGKGKQEWSARDPAGEPTRASDESMARDWHYLVMTCPNYMTAAKKLALIRWAVRNVKPGQTATKPQVKAKR